MAYQRAFSAAAAACGCAAAHMQFQSLPQSAESVGSIAGMGVSPEANRKVYDDWYVPTNNSMLAD